MLQSLPASHNVSLYELISFPGAISMPLRIRVKWMAGLVVVMVFTGRGWAQDPTPPSKSSDNTALTKAVKELQQQVVELRAAVAEVHKEAEQYRQETLGLSVMGPDWQGAHIRGDVQFDFAGGFPNTPNGDPFGLARLRTGTVRLDWRHTSLVAGQDAPLFSPLSPTSVATLATPALAYMGNLWTWVPQLRVERRVALSESSNISFSAGVLDSVTG